MYCINEAQFFEFLNKQNGLFFSFTYCTTSVSKKDVICCDKPVYSNKYNIYSYLYLKGVLSI